MPQQHVLLQHLCTTCTLGLFKLRVDMAFMHSAISCILLAEYLVLLAVVCCRLPGMNHLMCGRSCCSAASEAQRAKQC